MVETIRTKCNETSYLVRSESYLRKKHISCEVSKQYVMQYEYVAFRNHVVFHNASTLELFENEVARKQTSSAKTLADPRISNLSMAAVEGIENSRFVPKENFLTTDNSQQTIMDSINEAKIQRLVKAIAQQQQAGRQQALALQNQHPTILLNIQQNQNQPVGQQAGPTCSGRTTHASVKKV